jgi:FlaA1/EpsC-like NDP-sugar epimerase
VVGFIDDDPRKRGRRIHGVKILGDRHHLDLLTRMYKIQQVFVAIAAPPAPHLEKISQTCRRLGVQVEVFLSKISSAGNLSNERASITSGEVLQSNWSAPKMH